MSLREGAEGPTWTPAPTLEEVGKPVFKLGMHCATPAEKCLQTKLGSGKGRLGKEERTGEGEQLLLRLAGQGAGPAGVEATSCLHDHGGGTSHPTLRPVPLHRAVFSPWSPQAGLMRLGAAPLDRLPGLVEYSAVILKIRITLNRGYAFSFCTGLTNHEASAGATLFSILWMEKIKVRWSTVSQGCRASSA